MTGLCCRDRRGGLVLDLSSAKVPGIARLDLDGLPLACFQVRGTDQGAVLGYVVEDGSFVTVALFPERAAAEAALAAVKGSLMGQKGLMKRIALIGGSVVGGLLVLMVLLSLVHALSSVSHPAASPASPAVQGGVPADADARFGGGN